MLRHFFFRVHSRVSRAQSDFKFVSASRRNQHASGVRSPDRPTRPPLQQNASAERDGYNSRGDFANPTVFPDDHRQATLTKFDAILAYLFVATSFDFRLVTTVVSKPQIDYRKIVNAAAALEKQIDRYRQMTGEQRLAIALELHDLSCDVAREGIRRANPGADTAEVERLLHRRLELARAR